MQEIWLNYTQETLLLLLVLIIFLLLWILLQRHKDSESMAAVRQSIDYRSMETRTVLEKMQQELMNAIIQGQVLTQEGLHRNMTELQRQVMQDTAGLKTDLLGRFNNLQKAVVQSSNADRMAQQKELSETRHVINNALAQQRESFEKRQAEALKSQHDTLTIGMAHVSKQLREVLNDSSANLSRRVDDLTQTTDNRLKDISAQVEKRLAEGFEKTTETFTRVLEHLSRIDEAQKKITELSGNVVSLQEVLTDKRSRGAFGEVQLAGLVRNIMPEDSFSLQAQLSNGTRVDCLLRLPDPTGNVAIDAKFPLESFQRMMDNEAVESQRTAAGRQFRQDIKKHIRDIAKKYLIEGETADGAVMFIPAEAVFAEIHAHFPDLVEDAQQHRVWLVSPTTLMAVLTTARSVIKDDATRKQIHIIQEHLRFLSVDFGRFQKRMDNLASHIRQAHDDVQQVNISAHKISSRFGKIERVELDDLQEENDAAGVIQSQQEVPGTPAKS